CPRPISVSFGATSRRPSTGTTSPSAARPSEWFIEHAARPVACAWRAGYAP
ncbi:MAG: hypothetical protein AVDCRST_MAG22-3488, partial [uncultured Rubrobacteraceae bacterium]